MPAFGLLQQGKAVLLGQMPKEAEDQVAGDAEFRLAAFQRREDAVGDDAERHAARRMRLRIEEHLDMAHIVGRRALQVGPGEVVEIFLGAQNLHALVIEVEELLQVREIVGGLRLVQCLEAQVDPVARRQLHHQLGLEAAFDMQVKFSLGQALDEVALGHGSRRKRTLLGRPEQAYSAGPDCTDFR